MINARDRLRKRGRRLSLLGKYTALSAEEEWAENAEYIFIFDAENAEAGN